MIFRAFKQNTFEENMIAIYGDRGKKWLADVPLFVKNLAHQWGLSDLKLVEDLAYNYVLSGLRGTQPIILKIGLDHKDLEREIKALEYFKGPHTVKILQHQTGAVLLEHAVPGTSLHPFFPEQDSHSLEIACELMQQLHRLPTPEEGSFPSLADRVALLDKNWDIPDKYLHKARALKTQLLATAPQTILLHGDFHHGNILEHAADSWIVIDPQAVVGDPAYEIAIFMCNPLYKLIEAHDAPAIIANRIALAAKKCALDPARIYGWTFVHGVLSWAWSLEDGRNIEEFARLVEILDTLPIIEPSQPSAKQHD